MTSQALIEKFASRKVLVIGDAILDVYITGITDKICREAPAPVITLQEQKSYCGGAANTALNVAALGANSCFLSVIGKDESGRELLNILEKNSVNTGYIISDKSRKTIVKKRISAASNILVRIDEGNTDPICDACEQSLIDSLQRFAGKVDAVIVSDYEYGVFTDKVIHALSAFLSRTDAVLIVDAKDLRKYKKLCPTLVKPNYEECIKILDIPKRRQPERTAQILGQGSRLLEVTGADCVAATMDMDGTILFEKGRKPYRIATEPHKDKETIGAGDTFAGAAALGFCSGATARTAVEVASAAAVVVLQKEGTGICMHNELKLYFGGNQKFITDLDSMVLKVEELRKRNKKIVFTNGCFDILHRGHVAFLNQAKSLGDVLIVGLNTDESIRSVKGDGRPINALEDRVAVLAGLHSVNYLIAFEETSPVKILRALRPDLFVKGGTYTMDSLPEGDLVEMLGGEVKILSFATDFSTSKLIERIRRPPGEIQNTQTERKIV